MGSGKVKASKVVTIVAVVAILACASWIMANKMGLVAGYDFGAGAYDLTKTGRYFNPSVSPDGKLVSATEYPSTGGSRVVILNSTDGHAERIVQAPDSLQITETAWVGDRLFAAGLSDSGMGIYELPVDGPEGSSSIGCILGPQPVEVSTLRTFDAAQGPALSFVCDRSGVNEFHILDVSTGTLTQATSTRYGIHSPAFDSRTDTLYYSSLAPSDNPWRTFRGTSRNKDRRRNNSSDQDNQGRRRQACRPCPVLLWRRWPLRRW